MSFQFTPDERAAVQVLLRSRVRPPESRTMPAHKDDHEAWAWVAEEFTLWRQLFRGRIEGNLLTAITAHVIDPDRGQWWPRPADLARHLPAVDPARVAEQRNAYRPPPGAVSQAARNALADRIAHERWFHGDAPAHEVLQRVCDEYQAAGEREGKVIQFPSVRTEVQVPDTGRDVGFDAPAELVAWMRRQG